MKTKYIQILTAIFLMVGVVAFAQQSISGSVTDESGVPLPGATVVVQGTNNAAVTDFDGNFSINAEIGDTLEASYVGYSPNTQVASSVTVNFVLSQSNELDEVVITAQGITREKKSLGYAVSTLRSEDVQSKPSTDLARALTGKAAGVNIRQTSGLSGTGTNIIIRGYSSINGSNQPLFIVDGIPFNSDTNGDRSFVTGGGNGATIAIDDIGSGPLSEIVIDNGGSGYSVGDKLVFNNTGTEGVNAEGFVSVVNGAIAGDDGTNADHITLEDGTQRGDHYYGDKIVLEPETNSNQNDITDVFLINKGSGYVSLPSITITSSGANGKLLAHGTEIGRVIGLKTNELGEGYEQSPTPPVINFRNCLLVTNVSGNFNDNDTITGGTSGATGTLASFDTDTQVLKVKDLNKNFQLNETITSSSSGTAKVTRLDVAAATLDVVPISDTDGKFLNEDGYISEQTMKVQDSKYYQDFSYVLKVGQSINDWRDSFKKTMHTAGFYFTGQVDLLNRINAKIKSPVEGEISGALDTPIFSILNTLFSTLFGRRLGTVDDGTSQRSNTHLPADVDLEPATVEHFPTNTRDLTLTRMPIEISMTSRKRAIIDGVEVKQGYAYAGPRFGTLNKFANSVFGLSATGSGITFGVLSDIKVQGTRTSLDGRGGVFLMTSNVDGQFVKTNFAMPTQFAVSADTFDNTVTNFAQTTISFDDTTP